jgi:cell division protein FtsB
MRRRGWAVVAVIVAVGVLFVAVFPTRTWLAQRQELAATERKVAVLSTQNAEMAARVKRLNTDAEIERLARQDYNLVLPGEEALAILPSPDAPRPRRAPEPVEEDPGFWSDLWDDVTFWS